MNSGSLGNRSSRQPKQSLNTNQSALSIRPRTKVGQQIEASQNQCTNGICQISWKPSQVESKLPDNLGS
ncbi:hypothetical protein BH10CYA1_BH10CYA1_31940 [soil metagenome]